MWSWGNSCRILSHGSGSEVGQDARLPKALRQTLLWCQMGALLPAPAWGFPRAAGTHRAWAVTFPASCVGCRLPQLRVLGLSLTCAFSVGADRYGNYIWKTFDGHVPHPAPTDITPFLKHCQCRMRCWLCGPRGLQNAACQEEMFFWVFLI